MSKSIITNYDNISAISGRPAECIHHCCFGMGIRKLADQDGLTIPMTNEEHNLGRNSLHGNRVAEALSKMVGQLAWEKHQIAETGCSEDEARERFRSRCSLPV